MKYQDVIQRIRVPHLREMAADRVEDASTRSEAEELVSELLGMHLVESLSNPTAGLTGSVLPAEARQIHAGQPATSFPNDTYPALFEATVRAYTDPKDSVLHIFTRSSAPRQVGDLLDRQVVMVDEYVSGLPDLSTPNLLEPSKESLQQITNQLGLAQLDDLCRVFELIHIHLPCPGVVDRLNLLGAGGHSVYGRNWEQMSKDNFWSAIEAVIKAWTTLLNPRHLTIQCGLARWGGKYTEMFPRTLQIAHNTGWSLDNHWRLDLNPVPGPADTEALEHGWLLAFRNTKAQRKERGGQR